LAPPLPRPTVFPYTTLFRSKRSRTAKGPTGARSRPGWQGGTFTPGRNDPLRFTVTAIDNPQPATEVTTIDLISCKSDSAPCILRSEEHTSELQSRFDLVCRL